MKRTDETEGQSVAARKRVLIRAVVGFVMYLVLGSAVLFVSAGTLKWPMGWVYTVLALLAILGSRAALLRKHPDLLEERAKFTQSEGMAAWDRFLSSYVGLIGPAVTSIVAGLDYRFGWSSELPVLVVALAALVVACAYGVSVWAMLENRYFSAVARIQENRGQVVVSTGPYRVVRHPAYASSLVASLALPLMLGSFWALVPGVAMVTALVIRTGLEDRMLQQGLEGYAAYAEKTRFRLVPGIW